MAETKRQVTVAPFQLDIAEVTADAYRKCVKAGKCTEPAHQKRTSEKFITKFMRGLLLGGTWSGFSNPGFSPTWCTYDMPGMENHPVNCVTWDQANAYCSWSGKRLPTEEEWEWAARGADRGTEYPWGNEAPTYDHTCTDGPGDTHDLRVWRAFASTCTVGAYPKGDSPQGVKDLGGNVAEWTSSKQDTGSTGREDSELRVYRGGFWGGFVGEALEYRNGHWKPVSTVAKTTFTGSVIGRGLELSNRARYTLGFRCATTP
jgi:formylglycine-generating enzyme required for sulfatase activity